MYLCMFVIRIFPLSSCFLTQLHKPSPLGNWYIPLFINFIVWLQFVLLKTVFFVGSLTQFTGVIYFHVCVRAFANIYLGCYLIFITMLSGSSLFH